MKTTIINQDLVKHLNDLLVIAKFRDYCPNGLQVSGKEKIKKIAFAVSATLDSIESAIAYKADALIVHHGIIWNHDGAQTIQGPLKERIKLLLDHDINLIAYHLPLDAHLELGNAAQLALKLGIKKIVAFGDYKGSQVGVSGEFTKACKLSTLQVNLSKILNHTCLIAKTSDQLIHKVAIITGSGASYFKEAQQIGMECLITGEMSEYHWHGARELGINLIAGGHHATERFGVLALGDYLKKKYKLDCQFFDSENPI